MNNRKLTRIAALILAVILVLGCADALAAGRVSRQTALKTAKKHVPSTAKLTDSEWDKEDGEWEFKFITANRKKAYEVIIDGKTGRLKEIEMKVLNVPKAKKYAVTKKAAEKAVLKAFKSAKDLSIRKRKDDGSRIYEVTFKTSKYRCEVKVHGETGKIIEWEKKY